jgi:cytochrome c-type biogenesis protein CcmH
MKTLLLLVAMALSSWQLQAAIEIYQFDNPEHEQLYKQMTDELRCLVCQNQNLSASNSGLARDLREQTYEMVVAGKTREDIVAYMTQRYGDFVLYSPPVKSITILLWFGPLLLLVIGIFVLIKTVNRNKQQGEELNEQQYQQMKKLLDEGEQS